MKKYFVLKKETEISKIGCIPQTRFEPISLNSNMLIYQDDWVTKATSETRFDLTMESRGILTRFLSDPALIRAGSVCISKVLVSLFGDYYIDQYVPFPVNIHDQGKIIDEYKLMIFRNRDKLINWEMSEFSTTNSLRFYKSDLNLNSKKEYSDLLEFSSPLNISIKKLVFNTENIDYDLFFIGAPVMTIFISEELKMHLEGMGNLGRIFTPAEEFTNLRYMKR